MSSKNTSQTDGQEIAELALSLRNLSFTLTAIADGAQALEKERLTQTLFVLHRQVNDLSERLMGLKPDFRAGLASNVSTALVDSLCHPRPPLRAELPVGIVAGGQQ